MEKEWAVYRINLNSLSAKIAGTYSLVISNSSGCSVNTVNNIDIADANSQLTTTFKVSGSTSFCRGNSVDLSVSNNPEYKYQWQKDGSNITGATNNIYSAQDSGIYSLNVINSKGCKNKTEDVKVIVFNSPAAPLILTEGTTQLCQGDSVILGVTNTPGYSYQWKLNGGAIGTDSIFHSAKSSGTYTLNVSNSIGCSASSANSVPVTVNPLPVIGSISQMGNDTKFCRGESITLSVPPDNSYSYSWKNKTAVVEGQTTNLFIARETGEYTVEVLSSSGCKKIAEPVKIEVVEMPAMPSIDPGIYHPDICLGENPLRLSVKDTAAGYNYKWFKNGTPYSVSKYIDIQEGGNYYLEANLDICTSARDSLVVKSMKTLPKPDIFAHGSTVWHLSTTSKANYYKWYYNGSAIPDADKKMYVANQNLGIYRVGIADDIQCFSLSDTVRIPTNITGIEDNDPFENVKIFPNPTTGLITIEINNNIYGELEIDIMTINGLKIRNIKSDKISDYFVMEIDLTDYSSGMYIINLSAGKYFATRKIILR
ncbi:MAG: T9SS type A sorting domain-containing protein [Bacteroidetes bacterium]|nr:T9SS type A sorting domain-containing protein [Bacteroidota bacterium]